MNAFAIWKKKSQLSEREVVKLKEPWNKIAGDMSLLTDELWDLLFGLSFDFKFMEFFYGQDPVFSSSGEYKMSQALPLPSWAWQSGEAGASKTSAQLTLLCLGVN